MPGTPGVPDPLVVRDAEVRANGGEIVYRGPLRVDDPRWPDLDDPERGWIVLVFPDGSVRLNARVARERWFQRGDDRA